jgi:acyl-CoA synthetase (AMP-forming)/AMP-acid ligase II
VQTLGDLLVRERRSDDPAVRDAGDDGGGGGRDDGAASDSTPGATYSYHDLVTTAWKTANFFRGRGVHEGATVAVVDDPAVPAVLAPMGAAQLGAVTRFDPPAEVDADLLVGPGEAVLDYDLPPGATRVAYTAGANVADPTVEAFGRSVWSENPIAPPEAVPPGAPALWTPDGALPQSDLLARAEAAAVDLSPGDEVVVRAPLADVGTVVVGVLAPLLVGATVVFPGSDTVGDVAVGHTPAPEPRVVVPADTVHGPDE